MIYERHGLRLTVYAPNEQAADNLERLFYFWPDNDPPPPTRARVEDVDAAEIKHDKETPKCD